MKIYKTMENGVQIVEYEDSLAPSVAEMWNKSGDSWGGDTSITTAEQVIMQNNSGSYFNTFIAVDNGEVVGFCSFDRYYKDADTLYVHVLNVRPDYHGKKVGKELVLQCVMRTIELGYPRLDIHTWAGNTKAAPLYKRCGFLWEDRADSTHLSNYIPTVLKTEAVKDFFINADWYSDSTRVIDMKPDGVLVNKFEVYGYSWEKDGNCLSVSFEKTGRRIQLIETNDYRIEFIAQNHELAFGLKYSCTFTAVNKSGKELHIKIKGKNDKEISFDFEDERNVVEKEVFDASFTVSAITDELDTWRMHPCVLADVYINGKHAEFGLGIEPKFPLKAEVVEKRLLARAGITEDVFINIKSALFSKATVSFCLPDNGLNKFHDKEFTFDINPGETKTVKTGADILACGYEKIQIAYKIKLEDGTETSFKKPVHLVNQGVDSMFAAEYDNEHIAVCGTWKVVLYKDSNHVAAFSHPWRGSVNFNVAKLGKPYNDDFNIEKPSDIRIYPASGELKMVMEADFVSKTFAGITLTEIFTVTPTGIVTRSHKVRNNGDKEIPVYVKEEMWSSVGHRPIFHYDGKIHATTDNLSYGFSNLHSEKIDENWIFNDSKNPCCIYWSKKYKPTARWGDSLVFEFGGETLKPGEGFETEPNVYVNGLFNNFNEFRNYVLGLDEPTAPYVHDYIETEINGYNPFLNKDALMVTLYNNRLTVLDGEITVSSRTGLFDSAAQVNPPKDVTAKNEFALPLIGKRDSVSIADIDFALKAFEKKTERALFIPDNGTKIEVIESETEAAVINGELQFGVSKNYLNALHFMRYRESDYLFSKCDNPQPYAWWNPFVGGISAQLPKMNVRLAQKEKFTWGKAEETDVFGNIWTGLYTELSITEFEEHKGISYRQYFLTMPGLPVVCYFIKLINNSGGYKRVGFDMAAYVCGKENLSSMTAECTDFDEKSYRLRFGSDDKWESADRLAKISFGGNLSRRENLYAFKDARRDNGSIGLSADINFLMVSSNSNLAVENGKCSNTRPMFFILTELELTRDSLKDLERVTFN